MGHLLSKVLALQLKIKKGMEKMMNNRGKNITLIGRDKELLALFSGLIFIGAVMLSLAVTAGFLYL